MQWSSGNSAIATVSSEGLVRAVGAGSTPVIATSEGVSGAATLQVFATPPNLTLEGLNLTQSVQRLDGGVPLVAGGNPVLVNVFGTLDRPFRAGSSVPRVRVAVYNGTQEIMVDERPVTGTAAPAVSPGAPLHQVVLPATIAQPGLRVLATINPAALLTEASLADNSWPRSGEPLDIAVRAVPSLDLQFVPILLSNGGSLGTVTTDLMPEYLYATRQMHPVSSIDAAIGANFTSDVNFGSGQSSAWLEILQQLDVARVAAGSSRYYVGALRPPPGITFVQFGGYAYIPSDPSSTGPTTRTAVVVGVGWFNRQRQTTELVAHELGHTMGRRHAPCGGAAGPDPAYPYANASIGVYGHDLYSYSLAPAGLPASLTPATTSDVMSYCTPAWISDYNYEALLTARAGPAFAVAGRTPGAAPCECLVVWGSVEGDSIRVRPAFSMSSRVALPERPGSYLLEGVRRDGSRVFSYRFEPGEIDHAPGVRHFAFAIPVAPGDREAIARIRVSGRGREGGIVPRRRQSAPGEALSAAPVTATRAGRGGVEVRWNVRDYPASMVRDPATGRIVAIGTSGRLVLPSGRAGLEVLLSDGVRSEPVLVTPP